MTDHLADIASDLSAFHGIRDASQMEGAVFFMLAYRLPAYQGAMAAVAAQQRQGGSQQRPAQGQRYEQARPAITPRTAHEAPAATQASLRALNTELGATWFSVRTVKAGEVTPDG